MKQSKGHISRAGECDNASEFDKQRVAANKSDQTERYSPVSTGNQEWWSTVCVMGEVNKSLQC